MPSVADFDETTAPGFYFSRIPDAFTFTVFEKDGKLHMTDDCGTAPLTHVKGDLYRQGRLRHFCGWEIMTPCCPRRRSTTICKKPMRAR